MDPMTSPGIPPQTVSRTGTIIITIIITAVIVGFGTYWLTPKATAPTVSLTPTPSASADTSGWKTYTNTQYGFEFKYPESWSTMQVEKTLIKLSDYKGSGATDEPHNFFAVQTDTSVAKGQSTLFNGVNAVITEWHDPEVGTGFAKNIIILTKPQLRITLLALDENAKILENQILSTFRFTK